MDRRHELRTPLTSIAGFIDLLLRGFAGPMPDQAIEYLGIVQRNVAGLTGQVQELLEFSRLESGSFPLDLEPATFARLSPRRLPPFLRW